MYQIIQSFKTGETVLEEVPAPKVKKGHVLIKTTFSLVSLGTERMLIEFGKSNLISKARQQPDKVKQVLDKIKTDGLLPTLEAVFNKLEQPIPLGYCNVGEIIEIGEGVSGYSVGDKVVSNGQHAEYVCIPKNLIAKVPSNVKDEEAVFTIIGSIGLQGIRLLKPTLGETVVVIGMGLIGMITAQLLIASGCKVIGVDVDNDKLNLCKKWGIITFNPSEGDVVKFVEDQTFGTGCDGVIITASNKSNDIISQAARMSRKRGRIILVGVIGLQLNRAEFYEKELTFQVSCSYGPGRYDEDYEQKGFDYPLSFVRWTEKRNFEAVLQSISMGTLKVHEMITETVPLKEFQKIYNSISSSKNIASLLQYDSLNSNKPSQNIRINSHSVPTNNPKVTIGIIGAGNFTKMTLLPILKKLDVNFCSIASESGITGTLLAKKYGINCSTTNYKSILEDPTIDLVIITTRHNSHAQLVEESLLSGKNVFVEKPLAINSTQLDKLIGVYLDQDTHNFKTLTVGFNRRFSPHSQKIKLALGNQLMNVVITINAGSIPSNVWVHDMESGGGRIIGEACHFIDLITFYTGSKIKSVCMNSLGTNPKENTDNATILLKFENGSTGVINYFANGSKAYPKERIEIYSQERTVVVDNFKKTRFYGFKGLNSISTSLNKGHNEQFKKIILQMKEGGHPIIPVDEIVNVTKASFAAIESLKKNKWIDLD